MPRKKQNARESRSKSSFSAPIKVIDVHQHTVEQAVRKLERILDKSFIEGQSRIAINHGKGTGTLRVEVQRYLRNHELVRSFHYAPLNQGGDGVTIAILESK